MKTMARLVALGSLGMLAACGTSGSDRTSGGAAAGAATGAGFGALGGPVGAAVGAVIGGGAGAIAGGVTKPSELNLGTPPWDNPTTRVPTPNGPVGPTTSDATKSE